MSTSPLRAANVMTRRRLAGRVVLIAVSAVAGALILAAGAFAETTRAQGTLQLQATFVAAYQFGPFCPPATAAGVECVRFQGNANVPGLGRATSTYVKTFDPADCSDEAPVRQFSRAVIDVEGKGTIELLLAGKVCAPPAPSDAGPLEVAVTGGSGIYAGASGTFRFSSSVFAPTGRCGTNLCGSATDTWAGSLTVPGLEFDLTPPAIEGARAKQVRAAKKAKRVRVRYAVRAGDAVDGPVPVACKPRSGGFFKRGRTTVTCSATDTSANTSRARFAVIVR